MQNIPLSRQIVQDAPPTFFSYEFQTMLEYHIEQLKGMHGGHHQDIADGVAFLYEGDFFGLLTSLSIPDKYHWAIMRCNNLYGPQEYLRSMTRVFIPHIDEIDQLHAIRFKQSS